LFADLSVVFNEWFKKPFSISHFSFKAVWVRINRHSQGGLDSCDFVDQLTAKEVRRSTKSHETTRTMALNGKWKMENDQWKMP